MFKVGLNPYGMCYTLGIQGNSCAPKSAAWFLDLAASAHARCVEFHYLHLAAESPSSLDLIKEKLLANGIEPVLSGPWPLSRIVEGFGVARHLGVRTVRTHLSPILCGDRAEIGGGWIELIHEIQRELPEVGNRCADQGLTLAIENHQDFGSEELLEFCEIGGDSVGICLDTGNPLAVGEEPLKFAAKVAHKVRHVHLKDYRAQTTSEGYRLVRCAIGDGAIPLTAIEATLSPYQDGLTATLESGALTARHIRLFTDEWWQGYRGKSDEEINDCLMVAGRNSLPEEVDWSTPAERNEDAEAVVQFEMEQMMKSIQNMQQLGWLSK